MTFKSQNAIIALQTLEKQISSLRHCAKALSEASVRGDLTSAITATGGTQEALDTIAAVTVRLKRQVVPVDGLGESLESIGELTIRTARMVFMEEVSRLQSTIHHLSIHNRLSQSLVQWSRYIDDVVLFIHNEMDRINRIWMPYRIGVSGNRTLYRTGIRIAQFAIREMGSHIEFAQFLQTGSGVTEWPDIRRSCTQMIATICLSIDADTDCPFLVSNPVWLTSQRHPPDNAPAGER